MPEICRFQGIVIKMYIGDHAPPHFHAEYAEFEAQLSIRNRHVLNGELPRRQLRLITEWASRREAELLAAWGRASNDESPGTIDPL